MTRRKEAGQALALTAFGLLMLMGFVGLGVDVGVLRHDKRLQQTAADAAAIAGAMNLNAGTSVTTGAYDAAQANGFADTGTFCSGTCPSSGGLGYVTVTVNYSGSACTGPCSGPHTGNANYVEVLVSAVQPTYFMKILGFNTQVVTARAVATNVSGGGPNTGCAYTLGPPSKEIGVDVQGSVTLNAPTCGIVDNGNFDPKGNALTVNAGSFAVNGTDTGSGPGGTVTCADTSDCPTYTKTATKDPMAGTPTPCSLGYTCTGGSSLSINSTQTVSPGTYSSISITGSGTVTFSPGVYIINGSGGFSCSGSPTINGTGVFFYFTGAASLNCQGGDTINFTAPSPTNCPTCPSKLDGILMYQDPNDTNQGTPGKCPPSGNAGPQLGGNTGSAFDGVLYFPNDQLYLTGNTKTCASGTNCSVAFAIVITDSMCLSGNATLYMQGLAGLPSGVSILTQPILVE